MPSKKISLPITGMTCTNCAANVERSFKKLPGILDVNVKSLEFHLYRGDFERWIADALEDDVLARKIKQLKTLKNEIFFKKS